ncbi:hypothetical protein M378DRAFT_586133 [Amanita muscaria Koide BX008]|uniref:Uncharacterized protein n=1 Tax=Amanita muscaria (strain Koide BX008) TaxID=946122 RepID=A0A0C2SMF8_AMAMK|nr:hypothetical protein M378DRAFT_586133 [Amanita muscaria Koide BX008]
MHHPLFVRDNLQPKKHVYISLQMQRLGNSHRGYYTMLSRQNRIACGDRIVSAAARERLGISWPNARNVSGSRYRTLAFEYDTQFLLVLFCCY